MYVCMYVCPRQLSVYVCMSETLVQVCMYVCLKQLSVYVCYVLSVYVCFKYVCMSQRAKIYVCMDVSDIHT